MIDLKKLLDQPYTPHESSGKFPISSIGQCPRKIFLSIKKRYKEEFEEQLLRTFRTGNKVHEGIMNEIVVKGNVNDIHVTAAEITLANCHPQISGRIDLILSDGKELYITDVKSCSQWQMKKFKKGDIPQNYIDQVTMYGFFSGIHNLTLLFVEKNSGEIFQYDVPYDETRAKQLIKEIEDFFSTFILPDKEPEKCDGEPYGCKCCGIEKKKYQPPLDIITNLGEQQT